MLKKIGMLVLAFALVFGLLTGCPDGGGGSTTTEEDATTPFSFVPELEVIGDKQTPVTISATDGIDNVVKIEAATRDDASSTGVRIDLSSAPLPVSSYGTITVEMELVQVTAGVAGFILKGGDNMKPDIINSTGDVSDDGPNVRTTILWREGNLQTGAIITTAGTKRTVTFPILPASSYIAANERIEFQHQAWDSANDGPVNYTVRFTNVTLNPKGEFIAVTGITGIPETLTVGSTTLTPTVQPTNAWNQDIVWSVKDAGTTGAAFGTGANSGRLTTTATGTVVITATIANGLAQGTPYTTDFTIVIGEAATYPFLSLGEIELGDTGDSGNHKFSANDAIRAALAGDATYLVIMATGSDNGWGFGGFGIQLAMHTPGGDSEYPWRNLGQVHGFLSNSPVPHLSAFFPTAGKRFIRVIDLAALADFATHKAEFGTNGHEIILGTNLDNLVGVEAYLATAAQLTEAGFPTVAESTDYLVYPMGSNRGYIGLFNDDFPQPVPAFEAVTDITGIPATLAVGTHTLVPVVAPSNATNQIIVWSVKTDGGTTASFSGNDLTTTAAGTLEITATITNGLTESSDYTKDFTIEITAPAFVPVTSITFTTLTGTVGVPLSLASATVVPNNATNTNINWTVTTDGGTGATISGTNVTATAAGTATLTATITDGLESGDYTQNFDIVFLLSAIDLVSLAAVIADADDGDLDIDSASVVTGTLITDLGGAALSGIASATGAYDSGTNTITITLVPAATHNVIADNGDVIKEAIETLLDTGTITNGVDADFVVVDEVSVAVVGGNLVITIVLEEDV